MNEELYQLRIAVGIAGRNVYSRQLAYIKFIRNPISRHLPETRQALREYLGAAEEYQRALSDLWIGLLNAAPFPGREKEMEQMMTLHAIIFSKLHVTRLFEFGE